MTQYLTSIEQYDNREINYVYIISQQHSDAPNIKFGNSTVPKTPQIIEVGITGSLCHGMGGSIRGSMAMRGTVSYNDAANVRLLRSKRVEAQQICTSTRKHRKMFIHGGEGKQMS